MSLSTSFLSLRAPVACIHQSLNAEVGSEISLGKLPHHTDEQSLAQNEQPARKPNENYINKQCPWQKQYIQF